jgi:hypothetical protein
VNVLISELGIKAIHLLHVAFHRNKDGGPAIVRSEHMAMKVLEETDVLNEMTTKVKAEHLELAFESHFGKIVRKFFGSAHWIFSCGVMKCLAPLLPLSSDNLLVPEKSLPQLFFSSMSSPFSDTFFGNIVKFCVNKGLTVDVCVPQFFKNTEGFDSSICWNEDVQEYFRKLKSGEKNVITLESLKEKPFYPEEAKVSKFTLEIIQKSLAGNHYKYSCTFAW